MFEAEWDIVEFLVNYAEAEVDFVDSLEVAVLVEGAEECSYCAK